MRSPTRGLLLVLFASACLSTLPAAVKIGLAENADPLQLLAPRMVLGAGLLWLWIGVTRPDRLRIDAQGRWDCAIAGCINGIGLTLFYLALRYIDASVAIVIFTVYPAVLLLLLHLRGEPVGRLDWVRLALAVAGIALVANPDGSIDVLGMGLALACAGLYALYMLVVHTRLVSHRASTSTVWILTFMAGAVVLLRLFEHPEQPLGPAGWAVVVWTAVVGTAVARLAAISGIRLIGGGQTALLLPVETVLSVAWATLLLGERMSVAQVMGGILVLASVGLVALQRGWQRPAPGP